MPFRKIDQIILHCSDSSFGHAAMINEWHVQRGFDSIGYHYVVLNGKPRATDPYIVALDGAIELGRYPEVQGAHAKRHNAHSLGVCLVGKETFTPTQFERTRLLVRDLLALHGLRAADVVGHRDVDSGKTCPNFDVRLFREYVQMVDVHGDVAQQFVQYMLAST